jgi:hypothetical protein
MASAQLSRRVEKVVGYPLLSELGDLQRREFHEALLEAGRFEDLPGKWQAAILKAESKGPKLRAIRWRYEKTAARSPSHVRLSIRKYEAHAAAAPPVPGAGTCNPSGSSTEAAGVSPERVRRRTDPDPRRAPQTARRVTSD